MKRLWCLAFTLAVASHTGCGDDDPTQPGSTATVITGSGSIQAKVDEYRTLLGGPDNGSMPGTQPAGRREINWDGVADDFAAPALLPSDFFNTTPRTRGALLTTPGTGVQVSADDSNPSSAAPRFGHINATYSSIFQVFSPQRLFSPLGSNIVDLEFFVPGTSTAAVVRGFGAVYTDIDVVSNTSFEFFDIYGVSLGRFAAPVANNGLSFLGVAFPTAVVHRVRIAYGNSALGPDDGAGIDVAVMDDFIYGEPKTP